jgi:hypothetical protein
MIKMNGVNNNVKLEEKVKQKEHSPLGAINGVMHDGNIHFE